MFQNITRALYAHKSKLHLVAPNCLVAQFKIRLISCVSVLVQFQGRCERYGCQEIFNGDLLKHTYDRERAHAPFDDWMAFLTFDGALPAPLFLKQRSHTWFVTTLDFCITMVQSLLNFIAVSTITFSQSFSAVQAYAPDQLHMTHTRGANGDPFNPKPSNLVAHSTASSSSSRRGFVSHSLAFVLGTTSASFLADTNSYFNGVITSEASFGGVANAVGPIKINIVNPTYSAAPCPPSKPIPGEKAMKGMRGLCVTVKAELEETPPKVSSSCGVSVRAVCYMRQCLIHLEAIRFERTEKMDFSYMVVYPFLVILVQNIAV